MAIGFLKDPISNFFRYGMCSSLFTFITYIMVLLGMLDPNRGLLLVILAVLLHEPDEPTDRPDRHTQNCGCHPLVLGQFYRS